MHGPDAPQFQALRIKMETERIPQIMEVLDIERAGIEADLGFDEDAVIASYLLAHEARRDRAEALHAAARFCRLKERYQQGFELANRGILIKRPDNAFLPEYWIYEYGLLDEYAINAYWTGRYDECLKSCRKILGTAPLGDAERKRIQANADFARQKDPFRPPEQAADGGGPLDPGRRRCVGWHGEKRRKIGYHLPTPDAAPDQFLLQGLRWSAHNRYFSPGDNNVGFGPYCTHSER